RANHLERVGRKAASLNPEYSGYGRRVAGRNETSSFVVSRARLGGNVMRRFFPMLVQPFLLLPLFLLVGAVGPAKTLAAQLTLTWTDTSNNEVGFEIER